MRVHHHHAMKRSIQQIIPIKDEYFQIDKSESNINQSRKKRSNYSIISITEPDSLNNQSPKQNVSIKLETARINDRTNNNGNGNVHVTLPVQLNRTLTLDEYEDLALGELNSTEVFDNNFNGKSNSSISFTSNNGTIPEAAMLISGRIRHPNGNKIGSGKQRSCELFGNICLRVEDYPM